MPKESSNATICKVKVTGKEWLTENTFILKLERRGFQFSPGQYFVLHLDKESREYSVCSGVDDDYIEIMVRIIWEGTFTPRLIQLKKDDIVSLEGPYGFFFLRDEEIHRKHYYFIATGVGISPFLSFIKSYDHINYTLIHGVRHGYEAYRHDRIPPDRRILCTSRDQSGDFHGRVTGYLKEHTDLIPGSLFYLCGNSNMIDEVTDLLEFWGFDPFDIRHEVFF